MTTITPPTGRRHSEPGKSGSGKSGLRRMVAPLLRRLDRTDPGKFLDDMLDAADRQWAPELRRVRADETAQPRRPFASGLPYHEQVFRRLTWPQIRTEARVLPKLIWSLARAGRSYRSPFPTATDQAPPELFAELEELARSMGAREIGYLTDIADHEIFAGKTLPYRNAVVFTVEMEREQMRTAPSFEAFVEVHEGYRALGEIAEAMSRLLRSRGYAAYPGTALGGTTDYVALGERAGLGASGYHGLLITPSAGARVRISAVYTNITNLPDRKRDHSWVRDFCAQCRKCVRSCPAGAIYDQPRPRPGGKVCIDYRSCRDYFSAEYGCAVCLSVCPFSNAGYDQVRAGLHAGSLARAGTDTGAGTDPLAPAGRRSIAVTVAEPRSITVAEPRSVTVAEPRRVAVVGAGPAGFYLTRALLERRPQLRVDLIERLPVPHGLLRFGVAPDHPEVKSKAWTFDQTLADARVRFFGNVSVGRDVTRAQLRAHYDAVVYGTGAPSSRRLGIPGEDLPGSLAATDLVGWYNGHPDHARLDPPLDRSEVAIVGMGNVALDVARMLVTDPERLARTDMAGYAVAALRDSAVTDVHLFGRRGPDRTGFTPRELRDLLEVPGVRLLLAAEDLAEVRRLAAADGEAERVVRLLDQYAAADLDAQVTHRLHLHFHATPLALVGADRVTGIRVARGHPGGTGAPGDPDVVTHPVGLVVRAIGYRGLALADVPFDEDRAVIPTEAGRVLQPDGSPSRREYATGWARRGPHGVIGTNKVDAEEVARSLLADLDADGTEGGGAAGGDRDGIEAVLAGARHRWVTAEQWRRLAHEERRRGSRQNRSAEKFTDTTAMLEFLDPDLLDPGFLDPAVPGDGATAGVRATP